MDLEKNWREQCDATHQIRERYGLKAALDYLLGEKLVGFAETADRKAEYACELPCFQAAIWDVFHPFEVAGYLASLKPAARKRLKPLVVVH